MEQKTILIIDDNPVNLTAIEKTLQSEEYNLVLMTGAERALRFLSKKKADLILLDVQMPDMDGVETLREIRKLDGGEHIPVVFLSGTMDENAAAEGQKLGIADYLMKSTEPATLRQRVRELL